MEVPEKLLQFKFHFIFATCLSLLLAFLAFYSPSALTVLSYFWPLVFSTALFFAAVVVFGQISPPESEEAHEKTGTELIDYVSGQPEVEVRDSHLPQTDLQ